MDFISKINIKELFNNFIGYLGITGPLSIIRAIIDISIVTYAIYKIIKLVRETRAWQLIKGIIVILIAAELSKLLKLNTVAYILSNTISILAFAMVVLFQPELRRGLEQIGRSRFTDLFNFEDKEERVKTTAMIEDIVKACTELSKTFTGALIVVERETKIGEIIKTGIELDSLVSSELLINIFTPNTPLHDGAVVIRGTRIKAASCFLPLTDNPNLSKELGTRHRAALGITEVSDAFAIVVSEESGKISFALNGGLTRNLTPDTLRKALNKNLLEKKETGNRLALWRVKNTNVKEGTK
ncbi:MAG TPA: TIGR00159 family protein [Clostridiaceae bacterium]|nr:TIGR00159 family protein [Clostridiaceae bacterium]